MRTQLRETGYGGFTEAEKSEWHAYDYGWRRAYLSDRSERSPIDISGQWFDSVLADAAERIFPLIKRR